MYRYAATHCSFLLHVKAKGDSSTLAGLLSHFSITFVETLSKFVEKKLFG
jgi:hypothetical protein